LGGRGQRRALVRHGRVLHVDDPVEGPPATEQLDVHLALDVHEDQAPREADGHHDELGPERPVQVALSHLFRRSVDEHVQGPYHARDGHHVEGNGTEHLTLLHRRHFQLVADGAKTSYLSEGLDLGVHDEIELAELAAARVRRLDPLLEAGLVHEPEAAGAVAGRNKRILCVRFAVTNTAHVAVEAVRRRPSPLLLLWHLLWHLLLLLHAGHLHTRE
ncbi:unnamed protein product, partial [Ixodes hexagonus]